MERAIDVAKYIYTRYKEMSGENIDEMKLHKLLYLCQRESLAILSEPMFTEDFEGWKFGPVCLEVREAYKKDKSIFVDAKDISDEARYIVRNIVFQYGAYESWKLSELSHSEISWKNARKGIPNGQNGNNKMELADIREDAKKVRPYDSVWDMYYDEFEDAEGM